MTKRKARRAQKAPKRQGAAESPTMSVEETAAVLDVGRDAAYQAVR